MDWDLRAIEPGAPRRRLPPAILAEFAAVQRGLALAPPSFDNGRLRLTIFRDALAELLPGETLEGVQADPDQVRDWSVRAAARLAVLRDGPASARLSICETAAAFLTLSAAHGLGLIAYGPDEPNPERHPLEASA
jgi:hypothetical protein